MDPGTVLFDASAGGRLVMRGEDRRSFLHNFCTNDIESLVDGDACEAFVTDMRGHVLGHVWVSAQPGCFWLHLVGSPAEPLESHLRKYLITEDVVIEDLTSATSRVVVCGDEAEAAADLIAASLAETCGVSVSRATVHWISEGDVLLWLEGDAGSDLPLAAVAAGVPVGAAEAFAARRIAALLPIIGPDINSGHLAQEVDRDGRAISFAKGCYLGQETIARVQSRGRVNRLLRGLAFEGERLPEMGAVIRGEEDAEVGRVGSVAPSLAPGPWSANTAAALAVIRREVAEAGTRVTVETPDGPLVARIVGPVA